MDLSKLPKLSQTPPSPQSQPPQGVPPEEAGQRPGDESVTGNSAEAWLSIAIGAVLLFLYPRFLQWMAHALFGTHFAPFQMPDGQIVPYPQVPEFWMDLGPVLFGITLIIDGLILTVIRRPILMAVGLGLTFVATAYNAIYSMVSFPRYGLAPVSTLAAVFGIYMCVSQWKRLRAQISAP